MNTAIFRPSVSAVTCEPEQGSNVQTGAREEGGSGAARTKQKVTTVQQLLLPTLAAAATYLLLPTIEASVTRNYSGYASRS